MSFQDKSLVTHYIKGVLIKIYAEVEAASEAGFEKDVGRFQQIKFIKIGTIKIFLF